MSRDLELKNVLRSEVTDASTDRPALCSQSLQEGIMEANEIIRDAFAEDVVIHCYTRDQAIEDGVLVDVTEWASAEKGFIGGFTCPVALTRALWDAIEAIPASLEGWADVRGRAHDVLWMASLALRGAFARNDDRAFFKMILPYRGTRTRTQRLLAVADGDGVTIGFPQDF